MAAAVFKAALLASLCAACASINATHATFEGTRWRATTVNGRGVGAPQRLFLEFGPYYLSAISSCNTKRSRYRVDGRTLVFAGGGATERGCDPELGAFDERVFAILSGPTRMRWGSHDRLTLSNAAGSIALEIIR